jgi:TrmH family RNA methyltransferase
MKSSDPDPELKTLSPAAGKNQIPIESILKKVSEQVEIDYVSQKVYAHMAYRGSTEGIIGWATPKDHSLKEIKLTGNPLILVVEAVEKPGNLGAILRTADAAGIDALIISDTRTDIYNPNVIRSSIGAVFTTQVGVEESGAVISWLKKNKIKIYCTALTASKPYTDINFAAPSAIALGTEATGLSETWLKESDQNIIIPMEGVVDSMNVSVSTGIVLFEAVRQRKTG